MAKNVDSPTSHFHFNQRDEAESKSRTFCRVCKKEFFGTDPSISRKQAQANAFTHWLRHCRNTFTSELKCTNGVVWVEVNAAKRSEEDRLNDTGPPRWTCPAKICDRKYQTPRSFHEHWNRIHTGIDPSLIDGIVDTPTHRGLEEGGDENENGTPSASGSNRGGGSSSKANGSAANQSKSNTGVSSSKPQKRTSTSSKASPKKKQQNQAAEDDEDEIDILTFDEDLSSTSNLKLDEIEKEIQELKTKNSQLNKRIESTEMELAEEKKLSNVLRSKTHSLEVTTFSLRDELDQEKLFSESLKSQAKLSEENSLKEIESLKEKLMDVNNNHGGSSNGVNGNSVGDEKVMNGEKSFGIDGNRLPDLKALRATAEKNSWGEPQPEPQLAFSSSSYSTQPLPNEASSSKDTLSPLKRKREEGEGIDQPEPENKMFKPMEPLLQNGGE